MSDRVTNVVIAGLGGQGVLKASDILADAAFACGWDVKKSEIHGMSQRGGSVSSDVRIGTKVLSPMVPDGEADYVLVLSEDQVELSRRHLRQGGTMITPESLGSVELPNRRSLNVALLGVLSAHLDLNEAAWHDAIRANLAEKLHKVNFEAFAAGRRAGPQPKRRAWTP